MTIRLFGRLRRREFIQAFLTGLAAPFFANTAASSQNYFNLEKSASANNSTALENQKPGTTDWQLTNPVIKREIECYVSVTSFVISIQCYYFSSLQQLGLQIPLPLEQSRQTSL